MSYKYKRRYHPKLGKFTYQHKGSGLIVDNIFKPLGNVARKVTEMVLKPLTKKALKSGIEHAGERLGKKAAEKSGDLIAKRLAQSFGALSSKPPTKSKSSTSKVLPKQEDFNILLNQLISGSGIKKRRKKK